jgi:hypothetical protein
MQVDSDPRPGLVDLEKLAQPGAEESHHLRFAVGELDSTILFGALAGVEGGTGGEEGLPAEGAELGEALRLQGLDLGHLAPLKGVGPSSPSPLAGSGLECDIAYPKRDGRFGDAQLHGDVVRRPAQSSKLAGRRLLG